MADNTTPTVKASVRRFDIDTAHERLEFALREYTALAGSEAREKWLVESAVAHSRGDRATALRRAIYAHTEAFDQQTTRLVLLHHSARLERDYEQSIKDRLYNPEPEE